MAGISGWFLPRRRAAAAGAALLAFAGSASAQDCPPALSVGAILGSVLPGGPAESYDWQGEYQETAVCFPSRQSGAQLYGFLIAPKDLGPGPYPVVVIGPGSGGIANAGDYLWSARELAAHGYIALVEDPQGVGSSEIIGECGLDGCPGVPFQQASNFVDGLESATDFVFSAAHPWLESADLAHVGMAGHSLSARSGAYAQGIDERIGAVVAWDNLSSDLYGDAGISSGGGVCGSLIGLELPNSLPVTVRVPAMGQASDRVGTCAPWNNDPDLKKTAYHYWRAAGTPSMQLVFKDAVHGDWAQTSGSDGEQLRMFQQYTRAWFDLYLKQDESARARLLLRAPLEQPLAEALSSDFRSAVFMPEAGVDCEDLVAGCELTTPTEPPGRDNSRFGGSLPQGLLAILAGLWLLRLRRR